MSVIWSGITEEGAVVPVQVTDEGKVVAVADGPEGDYLPITGGTLTGDLNVSDGITLAADGSAEFLGKVDIGDLLNGNAENKGVRIYENGAIYGQSPGSSSDNSQMLRFYKGRDLNVWIDAGGSAEFGNGKIYLDKSGSASFDGSIIVADGYSSPGNAGLTVSKSGVISVRRTDNTNNVFAGYGLNDSSPTSIINADGSAGFAGNKCGFTADGGIFFTSRNARYKLLVQGELVVAEPYTRQMELKEKAEQFIADKRETKPSTQDEVTPDNDNA